ncbi:MAG: PEP-CTERM sorting domain-containing protein [Planctomycetia bacterium]|nr:PEP-CTERM sorting domain-containing protein [Planctomycetia bacterium]
MSATAAHAVTIDWVTVGDPGNAADTTGDPNPAGAVADEFRIMKYEWTNSQYVEFLNAVDPDGLNPQDIYSASMGSNARGGISFTSGNSPGSKYAARTNMGDKPVNYVSWFDAARVANWLQNGGSNYGSTDSSATAPQNTGAYTLATATSGTAFTRNSGAQYYIPTEDQWYKAAYYKGSGTNAGYWDYATQSDTAPTAVTSGSTGIGSAGSTGNFANFNRTADWNNQDGNVTTVGTNGGPSVYGAFDMGGNVWEWNEALIGSSRGVRGGYWINSAFNLSSSVRSAAGPSDENFAIGFRLAGSGVPEIDPAGLGSVLALVTGALGLLERRRLKAKVA